MTKELVISAYERPYKGWTRYINPDVKITVYRKGTQPQDPSEIFMEKNVGQDVHTFFSHILNNYDNLADYTIVSQDFPFDHVQNYVELINSNPTYWEEAANMKIGQYYAFSTGTALNWEYPMPGEAYTGRTLICKQDGSPHHRPSELNIDTLWSILFESEVPKTFEFVPAGHFIVSREQAKLRSKLFYEKLVNLLETRKLCPYEVERLEAYIFNPEIR